MIGCAPSPTPGQEAPPPWMPFLPFILIFGIFYFLLIRPQRQKQKEHKRMVDQLEKGDKVVTSGGIFGVVVLVKEKAVTLKVADNVKFVFSRGAISQVIKKGGEE